MSLQGFRQEIRFFLKGLCVTGALMVFASGSSTSITDPLFREITRIEKQATILFSDKILIEKKLEDLGTHELTETFLVESDFYKTTKPNFRSLDLQKLEDALLALKQKIEEYSIHLGDLFLETGILDSTSQTAHRELVIEYLKLQNFLYGGYVKIAHEDNAGVRALADQRIDRFNLILHKEIALELTEKSDYQLKFNLRHAKNSETFNRLELFLTNDNRWQIEFNYLSYQMNRGAIYEKIKEHSEYLYKKAVRCSRQPCGEKYSDIFKMAEHTKNYAESIKETAKRAEIKLLQGIAVYQTLINRWSLKRTDTKNELSAETLPAPVCAADLVSFKNGGNRIDAFPLLSEFSSEDRHSELMKYSYGDQTTLQTPKTLVRGALLKHRLFATEEQYRAMLLEWMVSVPGLEKKVLAWMAVNPTLLQKEIETVVLPKVISHEQSELIDIKVSDKKDSEGNAVTYQKLMQAFESYNLIADDLSPKAVAERTSSIVYQMRRDAILEALYELAQTFNPDMPQKDFIPQTNKIVDEHLLKIKKQWHATAKTKVESALTSWRGLPGVQKHIANDYFSKYENDLWAVASETVKAQAYADAAHQRVSIELGAKSFWTLPNVKRDLLQRKTTKLASFFMKPGFVKLEGGYELKTAEEWGAFFLKKIDFIAEFSSSSVGYKISWYHKAIKEIRQSKVVRDAIMEFLKKAQDENKWKILKSEKVNWQETFLKIAPGRYESFALRNKKEDTLLFKKALTLLGVDLYQEKYITAGTKNVVYQLSKALSTTLDWKSIESFEQMPLAGQSLGDQIILAEIKINNTLMKHPIFAVQPENEDGSFSLLQSLAQDTPYPAVLNRAHFRAELQNALSVARKNHVGLVSDYCTADLKKYDEDEKFRKIFLATSKPREVFVNTIPGLAYLDTELRQDTRTGTQKFLEDKLQPVLMVVGIAVLLIVAWQFAPAIGGFFGWTSSTVLPTWAMSNTLSVGGMALVKIFVTGGVSVTQIIGWAFSATVLYVNLHQLPIQLEYQLRVANSEIGYQGSEYLLSRPAMKAFRKDMHSRWVSQLPWVALDAFFFTKFTVPAVKNTLGFRSSLAMDRLSKGVPGSDEIIKNIKMPELKELIQKNGYWNGLKTYAQRYQYALKTFGKVPSVNIFENSRPEVIAQIKQLLAQKILHEVGDIHIVDLLLSKKIKILEKEIDDLLVKANEYYAHAGKTGNLSLTTKARIFAGNQSILWFMPLKGSSPTAQAYRQYIKMIYKPGYIENIKNSLNASVDAHLSEVNAFALWSKAKYLERDVLLEYKTIQTRLSNLNGQKAQTLDPETVFKNELYAWMQNDKELILMRKLLVEDAKNFAPQQTEVWKRLKNAFKDYDQLKDEALNLGRYQAATETVGFVEEEAQFKVIDPLALPQGLRNQDNVVILDREN